ncbi:hypothetical protein PAMA_002371 [Pampus argenteus]
MAGHLSFLLILTGLTEIHSLTRVTQVSVKLGGSISIPCLYGSNYKNHVKYLCEGYNWRSCSYAVKTNQPQRYTDKYSISDDPNRRIFTVTIKHLTAKDTNYWCAVEINGGPDDGHYFQLSVTTGTPHLDVTNQKITGFIGEKIAIKFDNSINGVIEWCKMGRSCVTPPGSIDGTKVTIDKSVGNVFTVTMSGLTSESSGWYLCVNEGFQMPVHVTVNEKSTMYPTAGTTTRISHTTDPVNSTLGFVENILIVLSLSVFMVLVASVIWCVLRMRKETNAPSATTADEENITYSSIDHMKKPSNQRQCAGSDVDVIYSTVITKK